MRLLLDTHIWLWSLLEPQRLGSRTTKALRSSSNELWISPISIWETLVLAAKGRIILDKAADLWVQDALRRGPFREAPLTWEIARLSTSIGLPHNDPADRFLAATAVAMGLRLVTADERLLSSRDFAVLPNA